MSRGKDAILMLVLGGMIVSTLFSSFITLTKYIVDPESKLPEITYWLMGGLSTVSLQDVLFLLPPMLIGIAPLACLRWQLNAMAFGDEEAQAMGLNVKRLRGLFILCATLLTAASVAIAGMIGWIGLIIPHMARFLVGPNCKELLPMSFLVGGKFPAPCRQRRSFHVHRGDTPGDPHVNHRGSIFHLLKRKRGATVKLKKRNICAGYRNVDVVRNVSFELKAVRFFVR